MFHHKYAIAAAITGISVLAAGVPVSASVSSEALREKGNLHHHQTGVRL